MSGLFEIDLRSNKPIYEQIVTQVKEMVLTGYLRPGDAMPSIRAVSREAMVNPNTVARAYQDLERLGLIETVVGRGTFIKEQPTPFYPPSELNKTLDKLKSPIMEMKLMGLTNDSIVTHVEAILGALEGEKP